MNDKKSAVERFDEGFIQEVIEAVRNNTVPWARPWQTGAMTAPHNARTGHIYSGRNAVRLELVARRVGYRDPRWATAKQVGEAGGHIRKGEKGTGILFYREKEIIGADGGRQTLRVARHSHVFNIEQTTLPVMTRTELRATAPDLPTFAALLAHHNPRILPGEPAYRLSNDTIYLPGKAEFDNDGEYYATALHEMAHWTAHPARLNRPLNPAASSREYAHEELVAELTSYMLSLEYGLPFIHTQAQSYLQHWAARTGNDLETAILAGFRDAAGVKNYLDAPLRERELPRAQNVQTPENGQTRSVTADTGQTEKTEAPRDLPAPPAGNPTAQAEPKNSKKHTQPADAGDAKPQNPLSAAGFAAVFAKTHDAAGEQNRLGAALAGRHVWLAVPYGERHAAKAAGAQWDADKKCWYAANAAQAQTLSRWQRSPAEFGSGTGGKTLDDLRETARSLGLAVDHGFDDRPGIWHRVPLDGRGSHNKDGAYKIFENADGTIGAIVKNLSTDEKIHWSNRGGDTAQIPREVLHAADLNRAERLAAQEQVRGEMQAARAKEALAAYQTLDHARGDEPYPTRKSMRHTHGIKRLPDGTLVIPLINGERMGGLADSPARFGLVSLQTISPDGEKRLMGGAQKQGAYFPIGDKTARLAPTHVILAEGVATADAAHQILSGGNRRVLAIAAVDVGNLEAVAEKITAMYPQAEKIIAADNDIATQIKHGRNPGLDAARALAEKYPEYRIACPDPVEAGKSTDWNDVLVTRGKGAATTAFAAQMGIAAKKPDIPHPDLANATCARDAGIRAYEMLRGNPDNLPKVREALAGQGFVLDEKRLAGVPAHPEAQRDAFAKAVRRQTAPARHNSQEVARQ